MEAVRNQAVKKKAAGTTGSEMRLYAGNYADVQSNLVHFLLACSLCVLERLLILEHHVCGSCTWHSTGICSNRSSGQALGVVLMTGGRFARVVVDLTVIEGEDYRCNVYKALHIRTLGRNTVRCLSGISKQPRGWYIVAPAAWSSASYLAATMD